MGLPGRAASRPASDTPDDTDDTDEDDTTMADFLTDIETIRARAREHIEQGPVTGAYTADRERVVQVLNEALATELVCVLRYKRHYHTASGLNAPQVASEFLEHADQEQEHADQLAVRITQLNGSPNFDPEGLTTRSHSEYDSSEKLLEMVKEDLIAERVAIETYSEIIRWIGDGDVTTRRLIEDILAVEEEHADDLAGILDTMPNA